MPDLYTNLVLSDKQFSDGLQRAESNLSRFASSVKGLSGGLKTALGAGGLAAFAGAAVDALEKVHAAQSRVNAGVGTFEDQWQASRGSIEAFAYELPLIGQYLERFNRYMSDFEGMKMLAEGAAEYSQIIKSLERRLELAKATTDEQRALVRARHEEEDAIAAIRATQKKLNEDTTEAQMKAKELRNFEINRLAEQRRAAQEKKVVSESEASILERMRSDKAAADSERSFRDMIENAQISALRRAGMNEEADRRQREQTRLRRLYEIDQDETLKGRFSEIDNRKRLVNELSYLEKAIAEKVSPAQLRSITGSGLSDETMGQLFAGSSGQDAAKKAAAAAERTAKENARQTELLKSIDRGIQRVGTRYGS